MPAWILKSFAHRVLSWLPRRHRLNGFFQKYVTGGSRLTPQYFQNTLGFCQDHFENYINFSPQSAGKFTVLELGTGWFPIVPVALYLGGASEIWSFDIAPLLERFAFKDTLTLFCRFEEEKVLRKTLPWVRAERIAQLQTLLHKADDKSPYELLESINIHARIGDARRTGLPSRTIDFVFANEAFEHISHRTLSQLLAEFLRVSSPDGVLSLRIGMLDQFSFFDRSITRFNFLKYTKRQWRFLDSPIIPQNRLRLSDYRDLLARAGYRLVKELNLSGSSEEFQKIRVAPEFQAYPSEELTMLYTWLVAKPAKPQVASEAARTRDRSINPRRNSF